MKLRQSKNPVYRDFILKLLVPKGTGLKDYVRPLVKSGMSRGKILAYCIHQGFLDEEIDGALIELKGESPEI